MPLGAFKQTGHVILPYLYIISILSILFIPYSQTYLVANRIIIIFHCKKSFKSFPRKNNKQEIMQNNCNCNCYLVFLMFCSVTLGMSLMIVVKT